MNSNDTGVEIVNAHTAVLIPVPQLSFNPIITSNNPLSKNISGVSTLAVLSDGSLLQLISIKFVGKSVFTLVLIIASSSSTLPLHSTLTSSTFAMFSRQ